MDMRLLTRFARHARHRPEYMASVLDRYGRAERLSDEGVAERLGLGGRRDLLRLGLWLRPRADSHFAEDVTKIAAALAVDPSRLAEVVRLVDALEAMTAPQSMSPSAATGFLMAARARESSPDERGGRRGGRQGRQGRQGHGGTDGRRGKGRR